MKATPPWLTDAQKDEIKGLYEQAARLTQETGVPHVVDHIVPLRGKSHDAPKRVVCGWHVPWNLQVITAAENGSKGCWVDLGDLARQQWEWLVENGLAKRR